MPFNFPRLDVLVKENGPLSYYIELQAISGPIYFQTFSKLYCKIYLEVFRLKIL